MFKKNTKTAQITYQAIAVAEINDVLPGAFIMDPVEGFMTVVLSNIVTDEGIMSTKLAPLNPAVQTYVSTTYAFPVDRRFTIYKKM